MLDSLWRALTSNWCQVRTCRRPPATYSWVPGIGWAPLCNVHDLGNLWTPPAGAPPRPEVNKDRPS